MRTLIVNTDLMLSIMEGETDEQVENRILEIIGKINNLNIDGFEVCTYEGEYWEDNDNEN